MPRHNYISTSFWQDQWIQSLDPSEKYMYLYLMTNPLTNISGVYKIGDKQTAFDTGYNEDTVRSVIGKFAAAGKAYRMGEYVILPGWPKHQNWEKKAAIKAGIEAELDSLSDDELRFVYSAGYRFPMGELLARRGIDAAAVPPAPAYHTPIIPIPYPYEPRYSIPLHSISSHLSYSGAAGKAPAAEPPADGANPFPEPPAPELNRDHTGAIPPDSSGSGPEPDIKPPPEPDKTPKPKKPPLREREPDNDFERAEKAYLRNWDMLYSRGRVNTPEPVVNWNQTRKLLKKHFEKLKPERIIRALDSGMEDGFVMDGGYSLGTMLSAGVLSRLINARQGAPPGAADRKSLKGLKSVFEREE